MEPIWVYTITLFALFVIAELTVWLVVRLTNRSKQDDEQEYQKWAKSRGLHKIRRREE